MVQVIVCIIFLKNENCLNQVNFYPFDIVSFKLNNCLYYFLNPSKENNGSIYTKDKHNNQDKNLDSHSHIYTIIYCL